MADTRTLIDYLDGFSKAEKIEVYLKDVNETITDACKTTVKRLGNRIASKPYHGTLNNFFQEASFHFKSFTEMYTYYCTYQQMVKDMVAELSNRTITFSDFLSNPSAILQNIQQLNISGDFYEKNKSQPVNNSVNGVLVEGYLIKSQEDVQLIFEEKREALLLYLESIAFKNITLITELYNLDDRTHVQSIDLLFKAHRDFRKYGEMHQYIVCLKALYECVNKPEWEKQGYGFFKAGRKCPSSIYKIRNLLNKKDYNFLRVGDVKNVLDECIAVSLRRQNKKHQKINAKIGEIHRRIPTISFHAAIKKLNDDLVKYDFVTNQCGDKFSGSVKSIDFTGRDLEKEKKELDAKLDAAYERHNEAYVREARASFHKKH